ncbi:redoxin family protein [Chitinophaga sancti]|uniref:redoxin family protein n=1 Tax=Chitinophaga sancti TaxID=1004 RepID=UPI002A7560C3|nr:redoxin family protein [Chitinophaga sancti]WPQ64546.1 redoxin family protein [Chitinophaga sancti]
MRVLVFLLLICNFAVAQRVQQFLKQVHTPMVAIVWLSPECPLCRNYTKPLNELSRKYANTVTVVGVFPGHWYTQKDYTAFQKKYKVFFPLLTDRKNKLGKHLHASVTPEVCLLNKKGKVLYQGAIDNWATGLGQTKTSTATEHYLEDAITNTIAGKTVYPTVTKPVGCFINDK